MESVHTLSRGVTTFLKMEIHVITVMKTSVSMIEKNGKKLYRAAIHINGMYQIGTYEAENEAAIAYNKAADMTEKKTSVKYERNYIENISSIQYASIYNKIILPSKFRKYIDSL